MNRGKTYHSELAQEKDKTTGMEVIRLSDDMGDTIHPYFTQPLISADGKILLVESNRTGIWQLYSLEMNTGLITQLTDDPDIEPHRSCLDPERLVAYYFSGQVLKSAELSTLRTEQIYVTPEGFQPAILSITADGRYLAFSYSERLSTGTGQAYSTFSERFFQRPRSVIVRIDLQEQKVEALWGECEWISHVNISPVDPDLVLFCHEGPGILVWRLWMVRASTHEVWPLLEDRPYLEWVTHEYFTKSGKVAAQWGVRSSPASEDWVWYDLTLNPDGTDLRKFRYPGPRPGHTQADPIERLFVGDRACPTPDFEDGENFIGLIRHVGDRAEVKLLCRHGSSWQSQKAHPHPIFTPDGHRVVFTSDRGGGCNVYVTAVRE